MFTTASILATFDSERQIVFKTDASDYTISMCINQPNPEKRLKFIAFYLQKMIPTKLNYEIHNKELLAIVATFSK